MVDVGDIPVLVGIAVGLTVVSESVVQDRHRIGHVLRGILGNILVDLEDLIVGLRLQSRPRSVVYPSHRFHSFPAERPDRPRHGPDSAARAITTTG